MLITTARAITRRALHGKFVVGAEPSCEILAQGRARPMQPHAPAGVYKVTLRLSSGGKVVGEDLRVPEGGSIDVPLPSTGGLLVLVVGRVVLDEDESPVVGQEVQIAGSQYVATTDADGRFEISRLTERYFNLLVSGYQFAERRTSFRLRVKRGSDGTHETGELRVTRVK